MDFSKWAILTQIDDKNRAGHEWVKVQRDHNLIKPDDAGCTIQADDVHALRLTWFGLCERESRRSGLYRTTAKGRDFLAGRARVPKVIWCSKGEVLRVTPETVSVTDIKGVVLDKAYWDRYAGGFTDE